MIELSVEQFISVKPLLGDFVHCIPLNGVLDGRHAGRVFVDDRITPAAVYVWTPWGYHYYAGQPRDSSFYAQLKHKLVTELIPQSVSLGESDILLTLIPDSLVQDLNDFLPEPLAIKLYRRTFTFNKRRFITRPDPESLIPPGFALNCVDQSLASMLVDDICATWCDVDEFLRYGFGYCLLKGSDVVSVCLSAFIAGDEVEIGVSTKKVHRRQGYASLTAAAFINHCVDRGLSPHWECFWDNKPSIGLAHKLGYETAVDVPIYYWQGPA